MPRIFILFLLLLCSGQALSASERVTLESGRSYVIALPPDVQAPALVIALHGGGGNGAQMERMAGMTALANSMGMAVAYPDGSGRGRLLTWNAGRCCAYAMMRRVDDVGFLAELIDDASRRFGIDRDNVFVTGMSNGGMMAERMAAERPDLIRAAASVAGPLDTRLVPVQGQVPLLMIHGTEDLMVPIEGGKGPQSITRQTFPSVQSVIDAWLRAFGGRPEKNSRTIDTSDDGMTVERLAWTDGRGREILVFHRVNGGGHSWPSGGRSRNAETSDINASREILAFFSDQMQR
jgi:polyhydroxybutyrate depolymerase